MLIKHSHIHGQERGGGYFVLPIYMTISINFENLGAKSHDYVLTTLHNLWFGRVDAPPLLFRRSGGLDSDQNAERKVAPPCNGCVPSRSSLLLFCLAG